MNRALFSITAVLALLPVAACDRSADHAAGDPARGRMVAEQYCSECHRVSPEQENVAFAGAPDFAQVNSLDPKDWQPIIDEMASAHIQMPLSSEWETEKADVIAWILSLEPQPLPEPDLETTAE
ncbi:MAG: cytochrome c [Rhodospirillaceae bacterium]|nr:cytochrome c [Rhodospirillaceae bacterium]